jgi:hypothetical protein
MSSLQSTNTSATVTWLAAYATTTDPIQYYDLEQSSCDDTAWIPVVTIPAGIPTQPTYSYTVIGL